MGSKSTSWDFSNSDPVRFCIKSVQKGPSKLEANSKCNLQSTAFRWGTYDKGSQKGWWGAAGGREGGNTEPEMAFLEMLKSFRPFCRLMTGRGIVHNETGPSIKHYCKWKVAWIKGCSSHVSGM